MRTPFQWIAMGGLLAVLAPACQKSAQQRQHNGTPSLTLSETSVKRGQPLTVIATSVSASSGINWEVSPAAGTWISSANGQATVFFSNPGTYKITAVITEGTTGAGYDSTSSPVTVSDSVYTDTTQYAVCQSILSIPFVYTDQVIITPVAYDTGSLTLVAHTLKTYTNTPTINYTDTAGTGLFACDFTSMFQYGCTINQLASPAIAVLNISTATLGTKDISFTLDGTTYRGSLLITANTCTFTWNYTTGVTIAPLQISNTGQ